MKFAGRWRSHELRAWRNMWRRCTDRRCRSFRNYGARGIRVCARWRVFAAFLADVGRRPGRGWSLGRRDNARGYEPGNVAWQTRAEQVRNTRSSRYVEHAGRRMIVADWARELGVPRRTIYGRLARGLPPALALLPAGDPRLKTGCPGPRG